jgi:hypothetical protein
MDIKKIKLSLLIFDYDVYPRHKISSFHVNELCQIIKSGKQIDPIRWDKRTKVILDGFHRTSAYKNIYGLDYEVEGVEIDCKDKADMILKSIEYNSKHGLQLSAWDKARCILIAKMNNIKNELIKEALGITDERFSDLRNRTVDIKDEKGNVIGQTQLKRGQDNIAKKKDGRYVTRKEADIIEGDSTTGLKAETRIKTLIKDIDLNNFEINEKNISMVKEFIELLEREVERYESCK